MTEVPTPDSDSLGAKLLAKEALPENLQPFEDFAMEVWDLIRGPNCNINLNNYDLSNTHEIQQALSDYGQVDAYLTELESVFRRNQVYFKSYTRDVDNLFGIFFRREFLPRSVKVSGMSQAMFESMADEEFTQLYGFNRTKNRYVEDVFKELKSTIEQQHILLKGAYWEIKDNTKLVELAFSTQNSGVPRLSSSRTESDGSPQTPMPRAISRSNPIPQPATAPPLLPPEFRFQG